MRYMMLYKPGYDGGPPPTEEHMQAMGQLIGEMAQSGVLLATDGLLESSKGVRVRIKDEKFTVTDGPFTETKELIAGFAMVRVPSRDEAIRWAKKFLALMKEGESEIREMCDVPAFP
jgi:hypothetical protein